MHEDEHDEHERDEQLDLVEAPEPETVQLDGQRCTGCGGPLLFHRPGRDLCARCEVGRRRDGDPERAPALALVAAERSAAAAEALPEVEPEPWPDGWCRDCERPQDALDAAGRCGRCAARNGGWRAQA